MFVEVIQGIKEGWRRGQIRELPENVAQDLISRGYVKKTRKRSECFGQDKSMAKTRRKGTKPVTKGGNVPTRLEV